MRFKIPAIGSLVLLMAGFGSAAALAAAAAPDPLAAGFSDPPASARPRVWWHWMNGNITTEGIRADLAWMKRVGIGGVQNFDANLGTPQIVARRLVYMTPEWRDAFRTAVDVARDKGLEFTIASSPGWSETGGPWVPPADAMKKLVWSETVVAGGRRYTGRLDEPPSVTGPYGSLSAFDPLAAFGDAPPKPPPVYYSDVAVLAFPAAAGGAAPVPHAVSGTGRTLDAAALSDESLQTAVDVERGTPQAPGSITLSYPAPRTIRAATFYLPGASPPFGDPEFLPALEVREGSGWRWIVDLPLTEVPTTVAFAPVTASEFRLVLAPNTGPKRVGLGDGAPGAVTSGVFPAFAPPKPTAPVAQLRLHESPMVHRFEAKAGFSVASDYYSLAADIAGEPGFVAPSSVLDLTNRLKSDGSLDWTPPPGAWRVLRMGYSLTGKTNHPATPEATGLEVDKYDGSAVRRYLQAYFGRYRDTLGGARLGDHGIGALLNDSIEVGPSNWTPRLLEQFTALRGYDPRPWLPALTGTVVGTRRESDAFLYDFRRTLADLIASEHYGTVAAVAHEEGMQVYGEALEDSRPVLGDDMAMRSHADIPMSALWSYARGAAPRPTLLGDMKGASSVAHLHGRPVVAAESFTSAFAPWAHAPADLRRFVDLEFDHGITRPVIHTSVHQPVDDKQPGLSLAIFGQYFNRHETWAEMAGPWIDYISRSSFLLQQGDNVADVAYFYGEEMPLTALYAQAPLGDTPTGYAYDFVNPDAVMHDLSIVDGALVTAHGARYRVLYLGGTSREMTLPVLRRLAALVEAGATLVGDRPQGSPALNENAAEYAAIAARLWSGAPMTMVGRGRVIAGRDVEAALASLGEAPDFHYAGPRPDSDVRFVHRRSADAEIYFVDNRCDRLETIEAHFRVAGRRPEIWRADTGRSEAVSYRIEHGETVIPLELGAEEAYFVVFREPAAAATATIAAPVDAPLAALDGAWEVAFQAGRGAPATAHVDSLRSLSEFDDPGIRYFSGTAVYTRRFELPKQWRRGMPLFIDLGRVGDVAEVRLNGHPAGIVWKPPYRLDVGELVQTGANVVEIRVANLWVNRLIGDAQPGAAKIAFTVLPTYHPDAPLRPAGLMGPVQLLTRRANLGAAVRH
jgi:hypothetical protein